MLTLPNAEINYFPNFYNSCEADELLDALENNIVWQHDKVKIFGKTYFQPRLTAFYGDPGKKLSYSGLTMDAQPWNKILGTIKNEVELFCRQKFNCVLLNLYRDGSDSNGWHADNESYLGKNPFIASISLGATRQFYLKHNYLQLPINKIALEHGSLLTMGGTTQHFWKHQIPKTKKPVQKRINLTFRYIL